MLFLWSEGIHLKCVKNSASSQYTVYSSVLCMLCIVYCVQRIVYCVVTPVPCLGFQEGDDGHAVARHHIYLAGAGCDLRGLLALARCVVLTASDSLACSGDTCVCHSSRTLVFKLIASARLCSLADFVVAQHKLQKVAINRSPPLLPGTGGLRRRRLRFRS